MILLDTHVWVRWLVPGDQPLPRALSDLIDLEDDVCVSAISHWEIAYLQKRGRLSLPLDIQDWLREATVGSDIRTLDLTPGIAVRSAALTDVHRDPADRFIIATALETHCRLLSLDQQFHLYPELAGLLTAA